MLCRHATPASGGLIVPNPYREIFRPPGTKAFAAAGFVARLPIAMAPLGIVIMLSQIYGEYWLAGAVAATLTPGNAVPATQIHRLVDRFGHSRPLTHKATNYVTTPQTLMFDPPTHIPASSPLA